MIIKKLVCLFLFLFFIQSTFSMVLDQDFSQETTSVFDKDFFRSAANIYIDICRIEPNNSSTEFLELVQKLIQEVLFLEHNFDGKDYEGNNLEELFYFFALSKKYCEKEIYQNGINCILEPEIFITNFIVLWSLTEHFLQDNSFSLKDCFMTVLYSVYYSDEKLFWILFDKYCCIDFKGFARYIYENDARCIFSRGNEEKILKDFFLEYSLHFKYFNAFSVELFLKGKVFNSHVKRNLFFKKRNFSLLYFLNSFVNFKKNENPSELYKFHKKKVTDRESIFDAQQRRVLGTIDFELFISGQEMEEIKGLFYV